MCGIAGGFGAGIDERLLARMCDIIWYRGPDDVGYYVDEDVALGVRRLSIIDLQTGRQPIHNEDETVWLVFNGEIFNYVELRAELEERHKFYTHSDTEVIVHLYEDMGADCVTKLNGMFAFALWDKRKRRLFLARDRMGVKPLYYSFDAGKLFFASEVKAILEAGKPPAPDRAAILDYMALGYVLGDKTFFNCIKQLPQGGYALLENGKLEFKQYWDLQFMPKKRPEQEAITQLRSRLDDAIRIRLRSDVPLGCHLSGGIDSSIVTGIASRLLETTVKTFTGAFNEGPLYDESAYSKMVSKYAGTEYHEVRPDGKDFLETLEKLVWYMDYPEVGPGIYPQYHVCQLASKYVKVILGGQGGDEVFAGYPWFVTVEMEQAMARDRNPIKRIQALVEYLSLARKNGRFLYASKRLMGGLLDASRLSLEERFFRDRSLHSEEELFEMFTPEFRRTLSEYKPKEFFLEILRKPMTSNFMDKAQYYYIKTYLAGLLHVEDRTSMAASIESRVPLCCDQRLVEFAATLEPSLRARGSHLKYALREAGRDSIPRAVYVREDKKGFPTPFDVWLRNQIIEVKNILLSERAKSRGIFDPAVVDRIIMEFEDRKRSRAFTIFMMLCVEFWFRQFIDKQERLSVVLTQQQGG
jgi:asparagine synthase (glutamine-hydrolysing)